MGLWEGRAQPDRVVEVPILDVANFRAEMAKFWFWSWQESGKMLFFQRRKFRGEILRRNFRVLHTFEPPRNLPLTLHRKFHRVFGRNFLVCHSPVRERFREGRDPKIHRQALTQGGVRDREIWKSRDRSGAQSSATSVSGTWLKREIAGALGQWACSQSVLGLFGLHLLGIIYRCPLRADVAHRNARFLTCTNARV